MRVRRRRRRNYTRLYILLVVLLTAIAGVFAASIFSSEPEPAVAESGIELKEEYLHVMLMGVDRRSDDAGRSDTLMVATINKDLGTGEILSVPRDTRAKIEKNGYDKINHAYAFGGHELTQKTVESLLGVPMDYYVLIDIKAFERIIDALDGIDIDVEKRMYYEDPWDDNGGLVIDLYPGMQHMTGEKAIQYVRFRDGEGDIGRINRQQHFIRAVMEKMLHPSVLPKLPKLMEEIRSAVETNMPLTEMIALAKLLPDIREHGLQSDMLPGKPAYLEDVSYWLPDIMQIRQLIASQMDGLLEGKSLANAESLRDEYENSLPAGLTMLSDGTPATNVRAAKNEKREQAGQTEQKQTGEVKREVKKAQGPGEISVLVINDSGINGAGAKMAAKLQAKGFNVTGIDTGRKSDRDHTIIVTDSSNTEWFYGMPFQCTIMDGGEPQEAVVYIGKDYE